MTSFTRICPNCSNTLNYKTKESLYQANCHKMICRTCHNNKKLKNKCEILLNESLESYYWLGFLMADGHFDKKLWSVSLVINKQDRGHLLKLKDFLNIEVITDYPERNMVGINFGGKSIIKQLIEKYKIDNNKTENPPDLFSLQGDYLTAFKIGFIDGDGNISYQTGRKDIRITIKVHKSWKNNMDFLFDRNTKINSNGYCALCIGKHSEINDYRDFINRTGIPFLERKWNKINNQNTN